MQSFVRVNTSNSSIAEPSQCCDGMAMTVKVTPLAAVTYDMECTISFASPARWEGSRIELCIVECSSAA